MTEDNGDPGDGFYRFLPGGRARWQPAGTGRCSLYPGLTCVIAGPWHRS